MVPLVALAAACPLPVLDGRALSADAFLRGPWRTETTPGVILEHLLDDWPAVLGRDQDGSVAT